METAKTSHGRLVNLTVRGLLGRFDHDITFDVGWPFLILHGPNSVGKTKLLELLYYTFTDRPYRLINIPFHVVRFSFDNGTWLQITRKTQLGQGEIFPPQSKEPGEAPIVLDWNVLTLDKRVVKQQTTVDITSKSTGWLQRLERDLRLSRLDNDLWIDDRTQEALTFEDLVERYDLHIMRRYQPAIIPPKIKDLLPLKNVHLIETQRLRNLQAHRRIRYPLREPYSPQRTVVSYANDLKETLSNALAVNSRASQALDRSFPGRLIVKSDEVPDTEGNIRSRYDRQMELRSRLAEISILELDSSPLLTLPQDRKLRSWERQVLSTYLDDTDEKLNPFIDLLERLELLLRIINDKFLFKTLRIDSEAGFALSDKRTGSPINLRYLSSGEQHQLVLMYDLLMKVPEHSLVLIDEPEISLHVNWQRAFLNDLNEIARRRHLRFIVATHSPQIIGEWWENTFELYRAPEDDSH